MARGAHSSSDDPGWGVAWDAQEAFSRLFFSVWEVGYIPPLGVGTAQTSFLVFLTTSLGQPWERNDL